MLGLRTPGSFSGIDAPLIPSSDIQSSDTMEWVGKSCHTVTVIFMSNADMHASISLQLITASIDTTPINSPNGTHGDMKKNERHLP